MTRISFDRFAQPAQILLALSMVLGLSVGTVTSLIGGEPQNGHGDRGENPVVGSLPCMVDGNMDLLFWEGMGKPDPGFLPAAYPVNLGLCGYDLREDIEDAIGLPYGRLDDRWDWRGLGLQEQARVIVPSWKFADGDVTAWIWAPPEYLGGEICMTSSFGDGRVRIGREARSLPIDNLVRLSGGAVTIANFSVKAPAGSSAPTLHTRVTVLGVMTVIEFL
ncbi:MAG: hypothetical protein MK209_00435 [Planctomycetes bacterium]|nr:hypothetical protein [Planctomycetota bacterium]